jgi:N-acetylglutamate synthase-like GNAT family acetyltransferase
MTSEFIPGSICVNTVRARNAHPGGSDRGIAFALFEKSAMSVYIRLAETRDIPALQALIEASVRILQAADYSPAQLEVALQTVYGIDTQLISDGTYFAAEEKGADATPLLVGCGGWSKRKTLYGGDHWTQREDSLLDPARDAAKIRAFFIHPDWARRGIGKKILEHSECAAVKAGFRRLEMGATLTGIPFYRAHGYLELETVAVPLGQGLSLKIVRMCKDL